MSSDYHHQFWHQRFRRTKLSLVEEVSDSELAELNRHYEQLFGRVLRGEPLLIDMGGFFPTTSSFAGWKQLLHKHMLSWQQMARTYGHFLHRQLRHHPQWLTQQFVSSHEVRQETISLYHHFLREEMTCLHTASARSINDPIWPLMRQNLAAEPDLAAASYAQIPDRVAYEQQVASELAQLQQNFRERYTHSPDPTWLVEVEIDLLQRMLYQDNPASAELHVYGTWELSPAALRQVQAEFTLLINGQGLEIMRRHRHHPPPPDQMGLKTESLFQFAIWLKQKRYIQQPPIPKQQIPSKLEWLGSLPQLEACYMHAQQYELFHPDVEWDDFYDHFEHEWGAPIQWQHYNSLLVYWFDRLIEAGFLPAGYYKHFHVLLAQHFLNRLGEALKPTSLASTRSQSPSPKGHERVDILMRSLGKPRE